MEEMLLFVRKHKMWETRRENGANAHGDHWNVFKMMNKVVQGVQIVVDVVRVDLCQMQHCAMLFCKIAMLLLKIKQQLKLSCQIMRTTSTHRGVLHKAKLLCKCII